MSALDELLLVLLALYLYESVWLVAGAAVLFGPAGFGGALRRVGAELIAGDGFTFVHGPLLLPFLPRFVTAPFAFAVAPDGIVAYLGRMPGRHLPVARRADFLPFDGATFTVSGKSVHCAGRWLAREDSAGLAQQLAERLATLAAQPRAARDTLLRAWLAERFDVAAAQARLATLRQELRPLQWSSGALFVWLALVVPFAAQRFGLVRAGLVLLGGLLLALAAVVTAYLRTTRPDGPLPAPERVKQVVAMAVYPAGAARAVDLVARPAFAAFEPVTVALAAGDAATREVCAGEALREARFAGAVTAAEDDAPPDRGRRAGVERWFREEWELALLAALAACRIAPEPLLAPPPAATGDVAWCPRCLARYGGEVVACGDCEGVALRPFATTTR